MIARVWHGVVPVKKADEYYDYLLKTGIPDYRRTAGNQGIFVFRRIEGDVAHYQLLTLWDSMSAIRDFAGDDVELARYYPEDASFLLELEKTVAHFDVLDTVVPDPAGGSECM